MGKSLVIKEGYIRQCHSKLAVLLWDLLKYNGRSKGINNPAIINVIVHIRKSHNRKGNPVHKKDP